jgi:hypothetical protein
MPFVFKYVKCGLLISLRKAAVVFESKMLKKTFVPKEDEVSTSAIT